MAATTADVRFGQLESCSTVKPYVVSIIVNYYLRCVNITSFVDVCRSANLSTRQPRYRTI